MEGTAFVHTSRMPKPVITFVFKGNPETRCTVSSLKQISVVCLGQRPHNRTGKVVALSKNLFHSHGQGCSKPGNICSGPSRGPEKQRGKRREGRRSRKARQKAKKKRPSAQPVPESQEEAMSWKARLRCWKRMAIKAWPKGDRKALCHRFSNARSGFKELEAARHWGEVAQVIQSTV